MTWWKDGARGRVEEKITTQGTADYDGGGTESLGAGGVGGIGYQPQFVFKGGNAVPFVEDKHNSKLFRIFQKLFALMINLNKPLSEIRLHQKLIRIEAIINTSSFKISIKNKWLWRLFFQYGRYLYSLSDKREVLLEKIFNILNGEK